MTLIFDIGYNHGKFTTAAFAAFPDAKVIGVEPNPSLPSRHDTQNFELVRAVVGNKPNQEIDFFISPLSDGVSTTSLEFMEKSRFNQGSKYLGYRNIIWNQPIKVKTVTLDSMIDFYGVPHYIKIDVEGGEYEVISGLSRKVPNIMFEWHEEMGDTLNKCVDHLLRLGYIKFGVVGYFDEGDVFPKATYNEKGDPHMVFPKNYYTWDDLEINKLMVPSRRVNYGMIYAQ